MYKFNKYKKKKHYWNSMKILFKAKHQYFEKEITFKNVMKFLWNKTIFFILIQDANR